MITVLLPSRGRPEGAKAAIETFNETKSMFDTKIVLVLSRDDPKLMDYMDLGHLNWMSADYGYDTLTKKLNWAVETFNRYPQLPDPDIFGFVADDNRFRTEGWDVHIDQALSKPGIAYGNDLYQGAGLPTSWFVSAEIVKALGWFALPTSDHMYLDNAWKTLGERLERLVYLPDVVIEHMHPVVGKGVWDETYSLSNTNERLTKDREAFENWVQKGIDQDVRKVIEAVT